MTDPLGGLAPPRAPPPVPKRRTPTTYALLIVLGIFFAVEGVVGGDWSVESGEALVRLGALCAPAVRDGDWWRLGAYAFLHIGWIHILMNGYSLYVLAPQLELTFGSNLTLGIFAFTALAGGAASTAWSLHLGHAGLAAGASGGVLGLFGATAALFWRVRARLTPAQRASIVRAIGINVLLVIAFALRAPVDNTAHAGGAAGGVLLGLLAPLPMRPRRPWHAPTVWLIVASALLLACMEGAAMAWAVRPRPRTLRGAGVEAQVPGLLLPIEPGVAGVQGEMVVVIARDPAPLSIDPGEDALRIGERTWLRQRTPEAGGETTHLAAADGSGRVLVELWCRSQACSGDAGEKIYREVARTLRTTP